MKRSRSIIVAFLLVACLAIGVGYAAINSYLHVDGGADFVIDETDFSVVFTNASANYVPASGTGAAAVADSYDANVSATDARIIQVNVESGVLVAKGDKVVVTCEITNKSVSYDAKISLGTISITDENANDTVDSTEYLNVTCDYAGETLAAGGTTEIEVVIELKSVPTENVAITFQVPLQTEAVVISGT